MKKRARIIPHVLPLTDPAGVAANYLQGLKPGAPITIPIAYGMHSDEIDPDPYDVMQAARNPTDAVALRLHERALRRIAAVRWGSLGAVAKVFVESDYDLDKADAYVRSTWMSSGYFI